MREFIWKAQLGLNSKFEMPKKQTWMNMMMTNANIGVFKVSQFSHYKQVVFSNVILSKHVLFVLGCFTGMMMNVFAYSYEVYDINLLGQACDATAVVTTLDVKYPRINNLVTSLHGIIASSVS